MCGGGLAVLLIYGALVAVMATLVNEPEFHG